MDSNQKKIQDVVFAKDSPQDATICYAISGMGTTFISCECGGLDYTSREFLDANVKTKDSLVYVRIEKDKMTEDSAYVKVSSRMGVRKMVVFNIMKEAEDDDVGGSYLNLSYSREGDSRYIITSVTSGVSSSYENECEVWCGDYEHVAYRAWQNIDISYDDDTSTFTYKNIYVFDTKGEPHDFEVRISTEREDHKIINARITLLS